MRLGTSGVVLRIPPDFNEVKVFKEVATFIVCRECCCLRLFVVFVVVCRCLWLLVAACGCLLLFVAGGCWWLLVVMCFCRACAGGCGLFAAMCGCALVALTRVRRTSNQFVRKNKRSTSANYLTVYSSIAVFQRALWHCVDQLPTWFCPSGHKEQAFEATPKPGKPTSTSLEVSGVLHRFELC